MNNPWLNEWAAVWWTEATSITWQSSLVILAALAIIARCWAWPARIRYLILLLPLLKLLLPTVPVEIAVRPVQLAAAADLPRALPERHRAGVQVLRPLPSSLPGSSPAHSPKRWNWKQALVTVQLAGIALGSLVIGLRYRRLRRILQAAEPVHDQNVLAIYQQVLDTLGMKKGGRLLLSRQIPGPVTTGVFRKLILLPATVDFAPEELRAILAHEAAHMKRQDLLVDWLQRLVQTLWWFNPLVWILNRQIRHLREECCDELLLARNAVEPERYCRTLLAAARRLAKAHWASLAMGIAAPQHPLGQRIRRILERPSSGRPARFRWQAALLLILGCLVLPNLRTLISTAGESSSPWDAFTSVPPLANSSTASNLVLNSALLNGVDWRNRALSGAALCNASLINANLSGADLRHANLSGAQLQSADLSGADLSDANLTGANLTGANLSGASLARAWLGGARLEGATLTNARLDWAFLRGAQLSASTVIAPKWRLVVELLSAPQDGRDLRGADLSNANLAKLVFTGGHLDGANLAGASLWYANLRQTTLKSATLRDANLQGSTLENADLREALLQGADLRKADLRAANLGSTDLTSANLARARLERANLAAAHLHEADLRWARLEGATLDGATTLDDRWRLAKQLQEEGATDRDLAATNLSELDLSRVSFRGAKLDGVDFSNSILSGGDFSGAGLIGALLDGTQLGIGVDSNTRLSTKWRLVNALVLEGGQNKDLTGLDLSGANLSHAQLKGAVLRSANLTRAVLDGTNLRSASLERAQLRDARFHNTVMPDGSIRTTDC